MKHIRNYAKAKKAMKEYFARREEEAKGYLKRWKDTYGNKDCWDEKAKCYRYKDTENVCTEHDGDRHREYLEVDLPKYRAREEAKLEAADKAGRLLEITIDVNWHRNSTWGMNPHAVAWVEFEDELGRNSARGEDRASGCGYDKRSAAVSGALQLGVKKKDSAEVRRRKMAARASIDRFVIEHEKLWGEYAVDRLPVPSLTFGGKGMSTFTRLFRRVGTTWKGAVNDYVIDYRETDRGSDFYHVMRADKI